MKKKIKTLFFWNLLGIASASLIGSFGLTLSNHHSTNNVTNLQTSQPASIRSEHKVNEITLEQDSTKDLNFESVGDTYVVAGFKGSVTPAYNLTIPDKYQSKSVVAIKDHAFENNGNINTLTIPKSVQKIGESAFSGCTSITAVKLNEGIEDIGVSAFAKCNRIDRILLPSTLQHLREGVFNGCSMLALVNIPNKIHSIGKQAFNLCDNLKSIFIPDSVTEIGEEAFNFSTERTSAFVAYILSSDQVEFNQYAFNLENEEKASTLLSAYVINQAVKSKLEVLVHKNEPSPSPIFNADNIKLFTNSKDENFLIAGAEQNQFSGLTKKGQKATDLIFPSSITNFTNFAFSGCEKLKTITIEADKIKASNAAFYYVPQSVKYYVYNTNVQKTLRAANVAEKQIIVREIFTLNVIIAITVCILVAVMSVFGVVILIPLHRQHKIDRLNAKLTNRRIDKLAMGNAMAFKKVIEATGMIDQKVDQITNKKTAKPKNSQPTNPTRQHPPVTPTVRVYQGTQRVYPKPQRKPK